MRKGFIFSIDVLFALSLIVVATISIYSIHFQSASGAVQGQELMRFKVTDASFNGFYHGQTATQLGLTESKSSNDSRFVLCEEIFILQSGSISTKRFCSEA